MPVAEPLDCDWIELRKGLKTMWAQTTCCANRIMTELYARDVHRNGQEKMPPMPRVYLYPELRAEFPLLPPQTVAALEQSCQRKYRALRYQVVWTAGAALATYRYPVPFPVHNQSWSATFEQDRPIVSVRIGDRRYRLRLKSGSQFRRQLGQFRQLASGSAQQGELAIYQRGTGLMVKMVAWLPRSTEHTGGVDTLVVRTAADCLLVAVNMKDETLWRYNGDHLRRWTAEHKRQLQRWSEDSKYENRPVPNFAARRTAAVEKFRNRMNSATHEIAAQLAGYAKRRKFAVVRYDDAKKEYVDQFPWFRLRALIGEKLDAEGIKFDMASGEAVEKTPEPLAEE
jgi:hypothetical protein